MGSAHDVNILPSVVSEVVCEVHKTAMDGPSLGVVFVDNLIVLSTIRDFARMAHVLCVQHLAIIEDGINSSALIFVIEFCGLRAMIACRAHNQA